MQNLLESKIKPCNIATVQKVSRSFVTKVKNEMEHEALSLNAYKAFKGRPKSIHLAGMNGLADFLEDWPTARLDECCDFLREEYQIDVSRSTVCRALKSINITHKRVTRVNARQDEDLLIHFMAYMAPYTVDQIVAVDESAANERTRDRKFGWSPRGQPCRVRLSGRRTTRWSILPALATDGWVIWDIWQGSYNADRFNLFIERLLEHMNPFPGPKSVILLDNATIHHSQRFKDLCAAKGVRYEYLPPYSPDLNPIKMSFHELKEWMRKERELGY